MNISAPGERHSAVDTLYDKEEARELVESWIGQQVGKRSVKLRVRARPRLLDLLVGHAFHEGMCIRSGVGNHHLIGLAIIFRY